MAPLVSAHRESKRYNIRAIPPQRRINERKIRSHRLTPSHEVLFEVAKDHAEMLIKEVTHRMTDWDTRGTPLDVDCEVGETWGGLTTIEKNKVSSDSTPSLCSKYQII